jgi:hypothetical protein
MYHYKCLVDNKNDGTFGGDCLVSGSTVLSS